MDIPIPHVASPELGSHPQPPRWAMRGDPHNTGGGNNHNTGGGDSHNTGGGGNTMGGVRVDTKLHINDPLRTWVNLEVVCWRTSRRIFLFACRESDSPWNRKVRLRE